MLVDVARRGSARRYSALNSSISRAAIFLKSAFMRLARFELRASR